MSRSVVSASLSLNAASQGVSVIEDRVVLAGKVGLADNVTIGEGAVIGAGSGVLADIPAGEKWLGYPAMRGREFLRSISRLRQWANEEKATPIGGAVDGGSAGRSALDDES